MKRILCAIDHSEPSLRGATLAMDLAARYQAELVLLTVVQLPDAAQPDLTEYLRHEHEPDLPGVLVAEAARDELRSLSGRLSPIFDSAVLQVIESARQFAPRRQRGTTRSGAAISLR
jgi:nucleotide-binding universal stress UspA family protein